MIFFSFFFLSVLRLVLMDQAPRLTAELNNNAYTPQFWRLLRDAVQRLLDRLFPGKYAVEMWTCDARLSCITKSHVDAGAFAKLDLDECSLLGLVERTALARTLVGRVLHLDKADGVLASGNVATAVLLEAAGIKDRGFLGRIPRPAHWCDGSGEVGVATLEAFSAMFRSSRDLDDLRGRISHAVTLAAFVLVGDEATLAAVNYDMGALEKMVASVVGGLSLPDSFMRVGPCSGGPSGHEMYSLHQMRCGVPGKAALLERAKLTLLRAPYERELAQAQSFSSLFQLAVLAYAADAAAREKAEGVARARAAKKPTAELEKELARLKAAAAEVPSKFVATPAAAAAATRTAKDAGVRNVQQWYKQNLALRVKGGRAVFDRLLPIWLDNTLSP